jgi:hypothetical protein
MKTVLCTLMLATLSALSAKADVTIVFDQPDQIGSPGETLQFFGTITNDDSENRVFLNSDDLTLNGLSLTTDDLFFANVPASLAAGESSGDIELFDVLVSNPLVDAPGMYQGSYTLFGGNDGGTDSAADNLGSANFSVTTVPEPYSIFLLLSVVLATLIPIARTARKRAGSAN